MAQWLKNKIIRPLIGMGSILEKVDPHSIKTHVKALHVGLYKTIIWKGNKHTQLSYLKKALVACIKLQKNLIGSGIRFPLCIHQLFG